MSKLNHERPYLKYIDNIRREIYRSTQISSNNLDLKKSEVLVYTKGKRIWKKMLNINLTENELENLSTLLELLNKYYEVNLKWIFKFGEQISGAKEERKRILKEKEILNDEMEDLRLSMVYIGVQLIGLEIIAKINGRKVGLFDWLKLLGEYMCKNNAETGWQFLNDDIFKTAIDLFDKQFRLKFD